MTPPDGTQLAQAMRQKLAAFIALCTGLDEATASRAPAGRWSPKEIASHLLGPDDADMLNLFRVFLAEDAPTLALEAYPENTHFTDSRAAMRFDELLSRVETAYRSSADFLAGLTPEQLERQAHIPLFRKTPMGAHPTLAVFADFIVSHIDFHITHMQEILQELGVS